MKKSIEKTEESQEEIGRSRIGRCCRGRISTNEIEDFIFHKKKTGGSFTHKEIRDIMKKRKFLGKFEVDELSQFMKMKSKGITAKDIENARILFNIEKFKTIRPELLDINNRVESLGIGSQIEK